MMVIVPAGGVADSDLIRRMTVLISCVVIFVLTKKNLVIPTILSGILLSFLN